MNLAAHLITIISNIYIYVYSYIFFILINACALLTVYVHLHTVADGRGVGGKINLRGFVSERAHATSYRRNSDSYIL